MPPRVGCATLLLEYASVNRPGVTLTADEIRTDTSADRAASRRLQLTVWGSIGEKMHPMPRKPTLLRKALFQTWMACRRWCAAPLRSE